MKINFKLTQTVLLVAILASCSNENSREGNSGEVLPSVEAVQAQFGSLPLEERLSGVVSAGNQVEIFPQISAVIEDVLVENGDNVERGDLLIRLRSKEFEDRLRQAQANLRINEARAKQAKATLDEIQSHLNRQEELAARGLISDLELERVRSQFASAEANYELALAQIEQAESTVSEQREALSLTEIRAPITGTVGQKSAEVGMQANPNQRLIIIGNLDDSKITINLTERMLNYIKEGQTVRLYSENFPDTSIVSEISRISPFLASGSFSTVAEIEVENRDRVLLPGMFVTVDVLYGESEQATIVPLSAIYRHPRTGVTGVYVAQEFGVEVEPVEQVDATNPPPVSEPTVVNFVPVNVIARGREAAGISGVQNGQWVITVGQNLMVGNEGPARIRATAWERILQLQRLRPDDLLREVMEDDIVRSIEDSTLNQSL